ncbi:MAG: hypothetical protein NVSMB9_19770 [Isosphaeraceae bacterium]
MVPFEADFSLMAAWVKVCRDVLEGKHLLLLLCGALVFTACLAIPRAGPWVGFALLTLAAWVYQAIVGDVAKFPLAQETSEERPVGTAPLARAAMAVVGASGLIAPLLVRNAEHLLAPDSAKILLRPGMAMALGAWVIVPVLLVAINARDRRGKVPALKVPGILMRYWFATLAALLLLPAGLCLLEVFLCVTGLWYDQLSMLVVDLFPSPARTTQINGLWMVFHYDSAERGLLFQEDSAAFLPAYGLALKHGYTLVGAIPSTLSKDWNSDLPPSFFRVSFEVYLAYRAFFTVLILTSLGFLLSLQARWLGLIVLHGSRRPAVSLPRAVPVVAEIPPKVSSSPSPTPLSLAEPRREIAPIPSVRAPVDHRVASRGAQVTSPGLPTILIIDDDRPSVTGLARNLASQSFAVLLAENAREGLRLANAARPDLILLNLVLPDRQGTDVVRELRLSDRTRKTPIVIVSPLVGAEHEIASLSQGADDFVVKPYVLDVLVARIRNQLARERI